VFCLLLFSAFWRFLLSFVCSFLQAPDLIHTINQNGDVLICWFSFVLCFNQLILSLYLQLCRRTFVSNSFHAVLVPFRGFLFACRLFVRNNTTLCTTSCIPQPPPISSTLVASPCVSGKNFLSYVRHFNSYSSDFGPYFVFPRVTPHQYTHTHLYIHDTHPPTNIFTPSLPLPQTHIIHSSPHLCLSRVRTSAPPHPYRFVSPFCTPPVS